MHAWMDGWMCYTGLARHVLTQVWDATHVRMCGGMGWMDGWMDGYLNFSCTHA